MVWVAVANTTYGSFFAQSCDVHLMVQSYRIQFVGSGRTDKHPILHVLHKARQHCCWPSWRSVLVQDSGLPSCTAFYVVQLCFCCRHSVDRKVGSSVVFRMRFNSFPFSLSRSLCFRWCNSSRRP